MKQFENPVLARFHDEPCLVAEGCGAWLQTCAIQAANFLAGEKGVRATDFDASSGFWEFDPDSYMRRLRPYVVKDGILHVPVKGLLTNNFPFALGPYATGYEYIWEAVKRGLDDEDVRGIALVIDSPGGLVAGNFDLVDRIYERRDEKPIRAFAAEHAYSAAYSIASVADRIAVTRSGGVGSIGVVRIFMEFSEALEAAGIKMNIIKSKPRKTDGSPYEPMSDQARARFQAAADQMHNEFVSIVARNRGMSKAAVDGTDALTFMAQEAIDRGLADEVAALGDGIAAFQAKLTSNYDEGDDEMAENTQAEKILKTDHETALDAAKTEAHAAGVEAGKVQGATDERARVKAIIESDEGKARPVAALSAALKTGMSVDEAKDFLGGLPEEGAPDPAGSNATTGAGVPDGIFKSAMAGTRNPEIESDDKGDNSTAEDEDAALIATIQGAGLAGFKPKSQ